MAIVEWIEVFRNEILAACQLFRLANVEMILITEFMNSEIRITCAKNCLRWSIFLNSWIQKLNIFVLLPGYQAFISKNLYYIMTKLMRDHCRGKVKLTEPILYRHITPVLVLRIWQTVGLMVWDVYQFRKQIGAELTMPYHSTITSVMSLD